MFLGFWTDGKSIQFQHLIFLLESRPMYTFENTVGRSEILTNYLAMEYTLCFLCVNEWQTKYNHIEQSRTNEPFHQVHVCSK